MTFPSFFGQVAPKCYAYLADSRTKRGLAYKDKRWLNVHEPDEFGFRGFTAYSSMVFRGADARLYSEDGLVKASKVRDNLFF